MQDFHTFAPLGTLILEKIVQNFQIIFFNFENFWIKKKFKILQILSKFNFVILKNNSQNFAKFQKFKMLTILNFLEI